MGGCAGLQPWRGTRILLPLGPTQPGRPGPATAAAPCYCPAPLGVSRASNSKGHKPAWGSASDRTKVWAGEQLSPAHPRLPFNHRGRVCPQVIPTLCVTTPPLFINLAGCTRVQLQKIQVCGSKHSPVDLDAEIPSQEGTPGWGESPFHTHAVQPLISTFIAPAVSNYTQNCTHSSYSTPAADIALTNYPSFPKTRFIFPCVDNTRGTSNSTDSSFPFSAAFQISGRVFKTETHRFHRCLAPDCRGFLCFVNL